MPIKPENIPTIYETATDIPLHIKEKLTEHEIPLSELDNSSLNHPDIDKYIRVNAEESYRTRDEHTATLIDYLKNNPEKGNNSLLLPLLEQIKEKNNEARVPMEARRMSIIRHEYQHTEDIAHIDSKSFISAVEKMNDLELYDLGKLVTNMSVLLEMRAFMSEVGPHWDKLPEQLKEQLWTNHGIHLLTALADTDHGVFIHEMLDDIKEGIYPEIPHIYAHIFLACETADFHRRLTLGLVFPNPEQIPEGNLNYKPLYEKEIENMAFERLWILKQHIEKEKPLPPLFSHELFDETGNELQTVIRAINQVVLKKVYDQ